MNCHRPLSFHYLSRTLKEMPEYGGLGRRIDFDFRISGAIGFAVGVLMYGIAPYFTMTYAELVLVYHHMLGLEVCCLGLILWSARRAITRFRNPGYYFEKSLDHDITQYRSLMQWLVSQPATVLGEHARFAKLRRDRMARRLPFLMGSTQLVIVLPIAAVLYLQVRALDIATGLSDMAWMATIALTLLPTIAWSLLARLTGLETCAAVLEDAMDAQTEARYNSPRPGYE